MFWLWNFDYNNSEFDFCCFVEYMYKIGEDLWYDYYVGRKDFNIKLILYDVV